MCGADTGRWGRTAGTARRGFTIVELLVVIAIVAVVAGIAISTVVRMSARNNVGACIVKMKTISQALAMYRLDEGAYPEAIPWALEDQVPQNGVAADGFDPDCLNPLLRCNRPGLWALYDLGYLPSSRVLVCPQNTLAGQSNSGLRAAERWGDLFEKLHSYESPDPETLEWKYLPDRSATWPGVLDADDVNYNRHLKARYPSDSTVVLWCPYHRDTFTQGGVGIDLVLFLDGHIEKRRRPADVTDTRAMLFPGEG